MLPYCGTLFLMSFMIPLLVDAGLFFFFFHVPFDTPFKFIVSFFFFPFYFIRITEAVLMRTIRREFCYMAHAIQLVVNLARSY